MKQAEDKFTIDIFDEAHEPLAPEVRDAMTKLILERTVGHTDSGLDTTQDPENNPVHEAVLFYWGGRCSEHDPECTACNAWKLYDNMIGGLK